MKNINTLINDLKKAISIEEKLSEISLTKIKSPVDELLEYAFSHSVIKNASDLLKLCKTFPMLESKLTAMYDNKTNKGAGSSGVTYYERIQDVPGYGVTWNERCIPDDVVIRGYATYPSRC